MKKISLFMLGILLMANLVISSTQIGTNNIWGVTELNVTNITQNGNSVLDSSGGYITTSDMFNRTGSDVYFSSSDDFLGLGNSNPENLLSLSYNAPATHTLLASDYFMLVNNGLDNAFGIALSDDKNVSLSLINSYDFRIQSLINTIFYVSNSDKRVGINTENPSSELDVNGTITTDSFTDGTITITGGDITSIDDINFTNGYQSGNLLVDINSFDTGFDNNLSSKSTSDLSEGTNLYYTETRVNNTLIEYGISDNDVNNTNGYFTSVYQGGNAVLDTSGGYITTSDMWNRSGENLYPSDLSNNVGIGTASPGTALEIWDDATNVIEVHRDSTDDDANVQILFRNQDGTDTDRIIGALRFNGIDGDSDSSKFSLRTRKDNADVEALTATGDGYIGIGTASPSLGKLEVDDNGMSANYVAYLHQDDSNPYALGIEKDNTGMTYAWAIDGNDDYYLRDISNSSNKVRFGEDGEVFLYDLAGGSDNDYLCITTSGSLYRSDTACS